MEKTTYGYVAKIVSKNFSATHQDIAQTEETKNDIDEYSSLNSLINSFLGTDLKYYDNEARLFGLPLSSVNLSNGQKVLLQLCVAIHVQGAKLENIILILDEPENHLHPSALTEYITIVKNTLKSGQIWIATHSIHLMSILDISSTWFMKDGVPEYAGRTPEKVLEGLIGDEEQSQKLKDFINLPAEYAINQFALECLGAPTVSDSATEDPQTNQIYKIINKQTNKDTLKILDYGAGKGRLLDGLNYMYGQSSESNLCDKIDYYAFDKFNTNKDSCLSIIESVYGESNDRYFNSEVTAKSKLDNISFDVVIMCNVLHEIHPSEWKNIFDENGLINTCLNEDGYLLIVEDLLIPIGEKPNRDGYFVLSEHELKKLFSITTGDEGFVVQCSNKERLSAVMINKKHLSKLNDDTIKEAIKTLKEKSKENIRKI